MFGGMVSPDYDVYAFMCRAEALRLEEMWSEISHLQIGHWDDANQIYCTQRHDLSQQQQRPQDPHRQVTVTVVNVHSSQEQYQACRVPSETESTGDNQNRNLNDQGEILPDPLHRLASGVTQSSLSASFSDCTELTQSDALKGDPLMTAGESRSASQTMAIKYPSHIVSQRLIARKAPIRACDYPAVKYETKEKETTGKGDKSCKGPQKSSATSNITKFENRWASKLPNPFMSLFTYIKRISFPFEITAQSALSLDHSSTLESIPSNCCRQKRVQSTDGLKRRPQDTSDSFTKGPRPHSGRSCVRKGRSFQCCACGRIFVLKTRAQKNAELCALEKSTSEKSAEPELRSQKPKNKPISDKEQNGHTYFPETTPNFTMTPYNVWSTVCAILAVPALYIAFYYGVFDDLLDFRR